jgi:O-antigen/teichoic acid export membrane protein
LSETRKLFTQSSHYLAGQILGVLGGFISFPIFTRILDKKEYGKMSLVLTLITLGLTLAKGGFNHSIARLYNDSDNEKVFYATNIIGSSFLSFVCLMILIVFYALFSKTILNGIDLALFSLAGLMILLGSATNIIKSFMKVKQETYRFNKINTASGYFSLALGLFFLVYGGRDVFWLFVGYVLANLIVLMFLLKPYLPVISMNNFSTVLLKSSLIYGLPMLLHEFFGMAVEFGDRFLVNYYLGPESVATYSVGYNISRFALTLLYLPVTMAVVPIYMQLWKTDGKESVEAFLTKSIKYYIIVGIALLFAIILLGEKMILILASEKYIQSSGVITYVSIAEFLFGAETIVGAGLLLANRTGTMAVIFIVSFVINFAVNIILLPVYGIKGAAIATLVSHSMMITLLYFLSRKHIRMKIHLISAAGYATAGVVLFLLFNTFYFSNRIVDVVARGSMYFTGFFLVVLFIDSDVRRVTFQQASALFPILKTRT